MRVELQNKHLKENCMGFKARERPKVKVGWNLYDSLKEIDEIFNLKDKVQCWKWCRHVGWFAKLERYTEYNKLVDVNYLAMLLFPFLSHVFNSFG